MDVTDRNKTQMYQIQDFIFIRDVVPILFHEGPCFLHVTVFSSGTLYQQKGLEYRPWSHTSTHINCLNYSSQKLHKCCEKKLLQYFTELLPD